MERILTGLWLTREPHREGHSRGNSPSATHFQVSTRLQKTPLPRIPNNRHVRETHVCLQHCSVIPKHARVTPLEAGTHISLQTVLVVHKRFQPIYNHCTKSPGFEPLRTMAILIVQFPSNEVCNAFDTSFVRTAIALLSQGESAPTPLSSRESLAIFLPRVAPQKASPFALSVLTTTVRKRKSNNERWKIKSSQKRNYILNFVCQ